MMLLPFQWNCLFTLPAFFLLLQVSYYDASTSPTAEAWCCSCWGHHPRPISAGASSLSKTRQRLLEQRVKGIGDGDEIIPLRWRRRRQVHVLFASNDGPVVPSGAADDDEADMLLSTESLAIGGGGHHVEGNEYDSLEAEIEAMGGDPFFLGTGDDAEAGTGAGGRENEDLAWRLS